MMGSFRSGILAPIAALTRRFALLGAAALAAAVGGIAFLVKKVTDFGDNIGKMAKRTGLSIAFLQKLKFAAELGGNTIDDMEKAIRKITQAALDSDAGLLTYKREFDRLGVSVRANNGEMKDSETLFLDVAKALGKIENSTIRTAVASKLLGRAGTRILPMMSEGVERFLADLKEAESLGGVISDKDIANSERFVDELLRVKTILAGFGRKMIMPFLDSINDGLVMVQDALLNLEQAGFLAKFGDKLLDGAAALAAAGAIIIKAPNKFSAIGTIIVGAFKIGAQFVHNKIKEAFLGTELAKKTKQGKQGLEFIRRGIPGGAAGIIGDLIKGVQGLQGKDGKENRFSKFAEKQVDILGAMLDDVLEPAEALAKAMEADEKKLRQHKDALQNTLDTLAEGTGLLDPSGTQSFEELRSLFRDFLTPFDSGPVEKKKKTTIPRFDEADVTQESKRFSSLRQMGARLGGQGASEAEKIGQKQLTVQERMDKKLGEQNEMIRNSFSRNQKTFAKF